MDANQEVQRRKEELEKEFARDIKAELTRAALCNGTSMTLLVSLRLSVAARRLRNFIHW